MGLSPQSEVQLEASRRPQTPLSCPFRLKSTEHDQGQVRPPRVVMVISITMIY
jgi:hypothetical protein